MTPIAEEPAPARRGSVIVWTGTAALLLAPAIAMRFTAEVNWTALDFITAAMLVGGVGGAYEFLSRRAGGGRYRVATALALLTAFLLVWINLAVGIIGSERNDANAMYAGVLAIAVGGACLARFRAPGMARAMFAAAGAQVAVAAIALTTEAAAGVDDWPLDLIGVTALLSAMWLLSAGLFRRAV